MTIPLVIVSWASYAQRDCQKDGNVCHYQQLRWGSFSLRRLAASVLVNTARGPTMQPCIPAVKAMFIMLMVMRKPCRWAQPLAWTHVCFFLQEEDGTAMWHLQEDIPGNLHVVSHVPDTNTKTATINDSIGANEEVRAQPHQPGKCFGQKAFNE